MNDQDHADEIQAALDKLKASIKAAELAGLHVAIRWDGLPRYVTVSQLQLSSVSRNYAHDTKPDPL